MNAIKRNARCMGEWEKTGIDGRAPLWLQGEEEKKRGQEWDLFVSSFISPI